MANETTVTLNTDLGAALSVLPAALCAVTDGNTSAARRVAVLRAAVQRGLPRKAIVALARLMERDGVRPGDIRTLYALRTRVVENGAAGLEEAVFAVDRCVDVLQMDAPSEEAGATAGRAVLGAVIAVLLPDQADTVWDRIAAHTNGELVRPDPETARAALRALLDSDASDDSLVHPFHLFRGGLPLGGLPSLPDDGAPWGDTAHRLYEGLAGSISLSKHEKTAVIRGISSYRRGQLEALLEIFSEEDHRFLELDERHHPQLRALAVDHALDWLEVHADVTAWEPLDAGCEAE